MAFWDKISSKGKVEDRRSFGPAVALGAGGLGLGGLAVILLLNYLSGGDVGSILTELQDQVPSVHMNSPEFAGEDDYEIFASTVLGSTNDYWKETFAAHNLRFTPPKLVLFRGATQSGCGITSSEFGPNYCPYDQTIYLDETFFDELSTRFNTSGGDVAESYVIAHEVGHHVQNLLGIITTANGQAQGGNTNEVSVKQELQADCLAGLWSNSIRNLGVLEPGEINEALDAASAIGDDRIQKTIEGRITPENWTHGSSEQRVEWFNKGFDSGELSQCNVQL